MCRKITERERGLIVLLCEKVASALTRKYKNAREGVEEVMRGKVIEFDFITKWDEAEAAGEAKGRAEGKAEGKEEGKAEANFHAAINMLKANVTDELVKQFYPDYYEEAKKSLMG